MQADRLDPAAAMGAEPIAGLMEQQALPEAVGGGRMPEMPAAAPAPAPAR